MPELPNVPTTAEAGLPGMQVANWHAVVAPASTPPAVVSRLHEAIRKAMALPEVAARADQEGADLVLSTPEEVAAFLRRESARWGQLTKALGVCWE